MKQRTETRTSFYTYHFALTLKPFFFKLLAGMKTVNAYMSTVTAINNQEKKFSFLYFLSLT